MLIDYVIPVEQTLPGDETVCFTAARLKLAVLGEVTHTRGLLRTGKLQVVSDDACVSICSNKTRKYGRLSNG